MNNNPFFVNSWTATFDQRRGPTRCLEIWVDKPLENEKPDLLLYVSEAGRVRVFKRQKDGSVKRLR